MAKLKRKSSQKKRFKTTPKQAAKRKGKTLAPPGYGVKLADEKKKRNPVPAKDREEKEEKNAIKFILTVPMTRDGLSGRTTELQRNIYAHYDRLGYSRDFSFPVFMKVFEHFELIDKMFDIQNRPRKGKMLKYQVFIGLPNGPIEVKLLQPKWKAKKSQEEIDREEAEEEERRKAIEELDLPEEMKEALENIDSTLGDFDSWVLRWAEFVADDFQTTQKIGELRKTLNRYHAPISNTLKYGEIAEEGARFAYQLQVALEYQPGTKAGAEAFAKLAKPAGDLLKAISKVAPPGVSQFLEALGEAGNMVPSALEGMKHKLDPKKRWRHREEWKYL